MRAVDQAQVDRNRRTYRLSFPSELAAKDVHNWMQSVAGALQVRPGSLSAPPNIAFEVWATDEDIVHRMKVPWSYADDIAAQLRTLVPGMSVTEESDYPAHNWTVAYEYRETSKSRTLRIPSPEVVSARLLGSMQAMKDGEVVLMQWVVTAARSEKPPSDGGATQSAHWTLNVFNGLQAGRDEVADRREKLKELNMQAVLRVAAKAETLPRAKYLAGRIHSRLRSIESPNNRLVQRAVQKRGLLQRVEHASGMLLWPVKLATTELVSLMGWPLGNPHVAGLASGMPRQLAVPASIANEGRVIGKSNFSGQEDRRIATTPEGGTKHVYVAGRSGVGKTTLLTNMAVQDMQAGHGVIVMESKGDLFHEVLDRVPPHRLQDVIVIDVNDTDHPVGFNILAQGNNRQAVDQLSNVIASIYKGDMGVYTPMVLYHGLHALAQTPGSTFVDLPTLLMPQSPEEAYWRDDLVDRIPDKAIRQFWQRYLNGDRKEQDRMSAPVHNRMWQLVTRPEVRNIFGQSASTFNFADALKQNKIVLIFLNGQRVGQQTAGVVGTLLLNDLWTAVRTVKLETPSYLYMDEFQDFLKLAFDVEQMLAQARSFQLGMVLAHQNLDQLDRQLSRGMMANTGTKIVFQTSSDDAREFARQFGKTVTDAEFMNQQAYEIVARVMTKTGNTSTPVTARTLRPSPSLGTESQVRQLSRQKYGRAVEEVEREMHERRQGGSTTNRKRPKLGGFDEGWK